MPLYTKNNHSSRKPVAKFLPQNKFFIISGYDLDENNLRERQNFCPEKSDILLEKEYD